MGFSAPSVPDTPAPPPLPPSIASTAKNTVGQDTVDALRSQAGAAGTNITQGRALVDQNQVALKSLLGS